MIVYKPVFASVSFSMPGFHFDPAIHGPDLARLLAPERLPELGPGRPNQAARSTLEALTPEALLAPHGVGDSNQAQACLAGLWLHHDFLDESHRISQEIDTIDGSYWHGIMHRREPDYANAKYWFRRVGNHPIAPVLASTARELTERERDKSEFDFLASQPNWDHSRFVDLCEAAAGNDGLERFCRTIQLCEWQLLFDHCFRRACAESQ
jgi:hypothetical protein